MKIFTIKAKRIAEHLKISSKCSRDKASKFMKIYGF